MVNARLGVRTADDRWEIAAYAKNLFNAKSTVFGNSGAAYGTFYSWGDPRIVGAEVTVKF
jgi:outer membrane receptor protein involved in Fe transport